MASSQSNGLRVLFLLRFREDHHRADRLIRRCLIKPDVTHEFRPFHLQHDFPITACNLAAILGDTLSTGQMLEGTPTTHIQRRGNIFCRRRSPRWPS